MFQLLVNVVEKRVLFRIEVVMAGHNRFVVKDLNPANHRVEEAQGKVPEATTLLEIDNGTINATAILEITAAQDTLLVS